MLRPRHVFAGSFQTQFVILPYVSTFRRTFEIYSFDMVGIGFCGYFFICHTYRMCCNFPLLAFTIRLGDLNVSMNACCNQS